MTPSQQASVRPQAIASADGQASSQLRESLELRKLEGEASKAEGESQLSRVQREKVQAEIEDLRKPFWSKPEFYASISTAILAVVGLVFSWSSGWFDTQQKNLDAQKNLLEIQIHDLNLTKTNQEAAVLQLQGQMVDLTNQLQDMTKQRDIYYSNYEAAVSNLQQVQLSSEALLEQKSNEVVVLEARLTNSADKAELARLRSETSNLASQISRITSVRANVNILGKSPVNSESRKRPVAAQ